MKQRTACQNRIIALDRFAWPGLEEAVFSDLFCPAALWFRERWYSPRRVCQARCGGDPPGMVLQWSQFEGFWRVDPLFSPIG